MTQGQEISKVIAKCAIRTIDKFNNDLEESIIHHLTKAREQVTMTDSEANATFFTALEIAQNFSFEERAIYVKEVSETTEKWFDPMTQKTYFVTNRDFANRY